MNSMSRNQKICRVASDVLTVICLSIAYELWGGGAMIMYIILMILESITYFSSYTMKRLYWRKQIWRCDTCGNVIDDDAEVIVTFHYGGRIRRYDTSECMSAGVKEKLK